MTLDELRELAERLPAGGALTLPRDVLLELCSSMMDLGADLTVAQLAEHLGRQPSTVRGWCERGELPNAYRLNGREWRIPPAAVETFLNRQRPRTKRQGGASLSDWRAVRAG